MSEITIQTSVTSVLLIVDCDLFFPSTVIYSCALTLPFDFQVTLRPLNLILPTYMLLYYIYICVTCLYVCVACFVHHYSFWPPKKTVSKHYVYWSISYSACVATRWLPYVHSWSSKPPRCDNPRSKRLGGWKRWKVLKKLPQLLGQKRGWESQCQVEKWMWNL